MTLIEEIERGNNKTGKIFRPKEIEKERAIKPESMNMKRRKDHMKIRRELEALPEGIDPEEKMEIMIDTREETKALIEGNKHLIEGAEEIIAMIEEEREVIGTTLMKEEEDLLKMKNEGVARDPLVKRGPF